jgi:serine/threonine protein kinase
MGEVYRARDAKLGRDVALKVLPDAFARDAERMAGFQREAKVLALFRSVRARLGMVRIDSERDGPRITTASGSCPYSPSSRR